MQETMSSSNHEKIYCYFLCNFWGLFATNIYVLFAKLFRVIILTMLISNNVILSEAKNLLSEKKDLSRSLPLTLSPDHE